MQIDLSMENTTAREQIANAIRKKIISNEYQAGEKLSERALSEQFQVSKMPVKEAFRTLITEGLLETIPRQGTFVSKNSINRLEQIAYIRGSMEGVAVFFATKNITEQELESLRELLSQAWKYLSEKNMEMFAKTNRKFNNILINKCDNPYLVNIIKTIREMDSSIDQELKVNYYSKLYERGIRSYCEHCQILDAMESRNSILAEQLMSQHVRYSIKYKLRAQLGNKK